MAEIDPLETAEQAEEASADSTQRDKRRIRLNTVVAVTIALLATFMGVCKVKDDNIVQTMQQAQVDKLDNWSWYQARHIRMEVLQSSADQMKAQMLTVSPAMQAAYRKQIAMCEAKAKDQEQKMTKQQQDADAAQKTYDHMNYHDDQFDLSDTALTVAIAILAITALTGTFWLYLVALMPALFGVIMGLAGLFYWPIHPDWLAKMLGA